MAETAGFACLGKIGGTAVEKIGGYFVDPIGREYRSLFHFNSNIENLETQLEKLETTRRGVQMGVDEAKRNVRTIFPNVEAWLTSVNEVTTEAKRIIEDKAKVQQGCLNGWCPNLKLRYSVSKNAMKRTQNLERLQADSTSFNYTQLSYGPPPPSMEPIPSREFKGFESRRSSMEEIVKALKDDEIDLIGICGMGGAGKTTMVKEVAKRVKEENMFDEVAMIVVSQKPDLTKVQKCIADMFGLNLVDKENPMARASLLRKRLLEDNKKILVILDDIWAEFDLEDMGIPLGCANKSFKALYTSRTRDLWYDVQRKKEIPLELLSKEEAWQLFREKAGDLVDVPDLQPIAKQIMNECGRLPLALVIIGGALSKTRRDNVTKSKWEAMLDRLTSCSSSTPADKRLFSSLELSYSCLEDEEAKRLFLLCCLFEEDRDIRIEDLARYGMGLSLFEGINGMEKVRRRVLSLVDDLKSRYLLLDGKDDVLKRYRSLWFREHEDERVKVHDVVRDVGISIASRDKGALVSHGAMSEWPKKYEHCTSISVSSWKITELPEGLRCPNLEFLLLRCKNLEEIPCNFFEGMGELKVLGLRSRAIPSLQFLRNLQTFSLEECYWDCDFHNLSVIGELLNLEVLSFRKSRIRKLPEEIRRLTKLRLLDVTGCDDLERIPSGVISCLVGLEELYMRRREFGKEIEEVEFLRELESLSNLNTLEITIGITSDVNFPEVSIFSKLKKYTIVVRDLNLAVTGWTRKGQRIFEVNTKNLIPSDRAWINTILRSAECVALEDIGCNDLVRELLQEGVEGLQQLKCLSIWGCDTPGCLVNTMNPVPQPDATTVPPVFPNLESLLLWKLPCLREIWHGPLPAGSFGKLTSLDIYRCEGLGNLFQISMVGCLTQLKRLSIYNCGTMEQVIWKDQRDDGHVSCNRIDFPKLEYMKLFRLQRLTGFCIGIDEIDFPQLKELHLGYLKQFKCNESSKDNHGVFRSLFPQKVAIPKLEVLHLSDLESLEGLGQLGQYQLSELRQVTVESCSKILNVFPQLPPRLQNLDNLQKLEISRCDMMSGIVAEENGPGESLVGQVEFPQLKRLKLGDMPNLVSFFPKVFTTVATSTDHLQNPLQPQPIFNEKVAFPSLEYLDLVGLHNASQIWCSELPTCSFSKLKHFEVESCGSLRYLFYPSIARGLMYLQTLKIVNCRTMEAVVEKEEEEGEEEKAGQERMKDTTLFPQLTCLELQNLPKLRSFSRVTHSSKLPQLGNVSIYKCPNMETLSFGHISTPRLQSVVEEESEGPFRPKKEIWKDDLNSTTKLFQEQQQEEQLQQQQQQEHREDDNHDGGGDGDGDDGDDDDDDDGDKV